jgi:two-component system nitrogen regulation response regulator GlnG
MTALYGVRDAVDAMKAGAFDYIAKPFDNNEMIATVRRALSAAAELQAATVVAGNEEDSLPPEFAAMGSSLALRRLARETVRHAKTDSPVMIVGEIGTGKRRIGTMLHALSGRSGPFVDIDCTGVEETLLHRELYGADEQAGARGKFAAAAEGTLLLDEVSNIPWTFQDVLAEDLLARQFLRAGDAGPVPISARLLLSSTISEDRGIDGNHLTPRFRALFGDAVLEVPALRNRREDIPTLTSDFIISTNAELGSGIRGIDEDALEMLVSYHWPGNVHQLRSVIRRAALSAKERITPKDIELPLRRRSSHPAEHTSRVAVTAAPLKDQVRRHVSAVERHLIFETLQKTGWNKSQASRLLGVTYKTLLKKISEHGLERIS